MERLVKLCASIALELCESDVDKLELERVEINDCESVAAPGPSNNRAVCRPLSYTFPSDTPRPLHEVLHEHVSEGHGVRCTFRCGCSSPKRRQIKLVAPRIDLRLKGHLVAELPT